MLRFGVLSGAPSDWLKKSMRLLDDHFGDTVPPLLHTLAPLIVLLFISAV